MGGLSTTAHYLPPYHPTTLPPYHLATHLWRSCNRFTGLVQPRVQLRVELIVQLRMQVQVQVRY